MKPAIKITIAYLVIGVTWIVLSDKIAFYFFGDYEIYTQNLFQIIKGLFYVMTTAIILFFLINSFNRKIEEKVRELEVLNETLKFERNKLRESNDQLEQFADMTSHDLKSPLRTIINLIQRYKTKFKQQTTPQSQEYLDIIENSADGLYRKIDKTLLFSKISRVKQRFVLVDPNEIVEEVKISLARSIDEKKAQIKKDQLPTVKADKILLQNVFQNIIENSIKYAKKEEAPFIEITAKKKKSSVVFSIKDNGIGIPEAELEHVFERYKQLNAENILSGSGIGLASIRKILERLEGSVWIESEEGIGTTVFLELPR